jgi:mannose-6-phosphate isomerase-like protein (cupin superfamily)
MRSSKRIAFVILGFGLFLPLPAVQQAEVHARQRGGEGGRQMEVWAPLPVKGSPFIPPNKPLTKISALLAKHKGEQKWTETIVSDALFNGAYISMAPGEKTPRRFHQDNRAFWIVQDGQIRFTIEGQEPFVASRGFLVQVPKRLIYSLETVGSKPSLRFEVMMANSNTMYPIDETPAPVPGVKFERATVASAKGAYDEANVPFIDFNQTIAGHPKPKKNQNQFVGDAHDGGYVNVGIANIIRGDPATQPPAREDDLGHFHVTGPEFWFILEGQMEFRIGSVPIFVADQGDIAYAPAQTWHRVRFAGTGMATRLAIVGYANSHVYQATGRSGQ